jgi:hypothetical protein
MFKDQPPKHDCEIVLRSLERFSQAFFHVDEDADKKDKRHCIGCYRNILSFDEGLYRSVKIPTGQQERAKLDQSTPRPLGHFHHDVSCSAVN